MLYIILSQTDVKKKITKNSLNFPKYLGFNTYFCLQFKLYFTIIHFLALEMNEKSISACVNCFRGLLKFKDRAPLHICITQAPRQVSCCFIDYVISLIYSSSATE